MLDAKGGGQFADATRQVDDRVYIHTGDVGPSDIRLSIGNVGKTNTSPNILRQGGPMPYREALGARVRLLRKARGLTQVDAAEAIGVARSTLASIEAGHDLPGRDALLAIARFFKVSVDYLQRGETAAGPPLTGEFVNDPDELALLRFWRSLTLPERAMMLRMLRVGMADSAA